MAKRYPMFRAAIPRQIAGGFSNKAGKAGTEGIASRFEAGPSNGLSRATSTDAGAQCTASCGRFGNRVML